VKRVLEQIYEPAFAPSSYGYRPKLSQHDCLAKLGCTIQRRRVRHVVEADIRGFFDHVNHEWLMRFLEHRIGDPRILRLIRRMLKGGIMEDGLTKATTQGTPQGSILSPLLSNIYLHYVLDLWFEKRVRRQCRGEAYLFRFADDFVVCFQFKWLNRKSQRRAYTGDSYTAALQSIHWPRVRVRVDLNPYRSAEVF